MSQRAPRVRPTPGGVTADPQRAQERLERRRRRNQQAVQQAQSPAEREMQAQQAAQRAQNPVNQAVDTAFRGAQTVAGAAQTLATRPVESFQAGVRTVDRAVGPGDEDPTPDRFDPLTRRFGVKEETREEVAEELTEKGGLKTQAQERERAEAIREIRAGAGQPAGQAVRRATGSPEAAAFTESFAGELAALPLSVPQAVEQGVEAVGNFPEVANERGAGTAATAVVQTAGRGINIQGRRAEEDPFEVAGELTAGFAAGVGGARALRAAPSAGRRTLRQFDRGDERAELQLAGPRGQTDGDTDGLDADVQAELERMGRRGQPRRPGEPTTEIDIDDVFERAQRRRQAGQRELSGETTRPEIETRLGTAGRPETLIAERTAPTGPSITTQLRQQAAAVEADTSGVVGGAVERVAQAQEQQAMIDDQVERDIEDVNTPVQGQENRPQTAADVEPVVDTDAGIDTITESATDTVPGFDTATRTRPATDTDIDTGGIGATATREAVTTTTQPVTGTEPTPIPPDPETTGGGRPTRPPRPDFGDNRDTDEPNDDDRFRLFEQENIFPAVEPTEGVSNLLDRIFDDE